MLICGIYAIENLDNDKIYIGQSVDIRKRFREHKHHLKQNNHDNIYLQRAWNKYGSAKFTFKILEVCNENELNGKEIYYISKYRSKSYNLNNGGYGNRGYKHTEETKKKLKETRKLQKEPMLGKKHTKETKEKLSKINKGKKLPQEIIKKMIESHKGYKHSEETKTKMSETKKGNTYAKGAVRSSEERKKLSEIRKGQNSTSAKLKDNQVYEIKVMLKKGIPNKEIATMFNISQSIVCDIKHERTWRNIQIDKNRSAKNGNKN